MKMYISFALSFGALVASCFSQVDAGRASPEIWNSPIGAVKLVGDAENHVYIEVATGYPIVSSPSDSQAESPFVYAISDDKGNLVASKYPVKAGVNPDEVKELRADARPRLAPANRRASSSKLADDDNLYPLRLPLANSQGTPLVVQNFVLRVRFADHINHTLPDSAAYVKLMNAEDVNGSCDPLDESCSAPTGSVRDFFKEQSYGKLVINSTVTEWVDLPQNQAYYAAGCSGLCGNAYTLLDGIIAALTKLDVDGVYNWAEFDTIGGGADGLGRNGYVDMFTIITSGYGGEIPGPDQYGNPKEDRIWSHMYFLNNVDLWSAPSFTTGSGVSFNSYTINPGLWALSGKQISHIGIIVHETSHVFGLPDLYDPFYTSSGFGEFGLMSDQWGFDATQNYPPSLSPWSRERLSFLTPILVTDSADLTLSEIHTTPQVYKITHGYPANEYLLVEYRDNIRNDSPQPGSGVLIWKIDDNMDFWGQGNAYPYYPGSTQDVATHHYHVALIEADGLYQFQKTNFAYGDAGDIWNVGQELGDLTNPTLNSYALQGCRQTGNGLSGNRISITSYDNAADTFMLTYEAAPSCSCTTQCLKVETEVPTGAPNAEGSFTPTSTPTSTPTYMPTYPPTYTPTTTPTATPTATPTYKLTATPTVMPTATEPFTLNADQIAVIVGGSCALLLVVGVATCWYRKRSQKVDVPTSYYAASKPNVGMQNAGFEMPDL